jgi:hypothetical protein
MKVISPSTHGALDYLIIIFLWASPTLFVLSGDVARYTYLLGLVHLVLTLITNSSAGIFRFISMTVHGVIELLVAIGLIILSFTVLQYDERGHNFYLWFGIALLVIVVITDYAYQKPVRTPHVTA